MVAWIFVCQQVVLKPWQVHDGTDHLKDVRMKIITKCGGLRLAIKVMGGLLSTRSRSEGDWEAVLNDHAWSVVGLPKELDSAIYLSYEDLSPWLKRCFLYCSLFAKGTWIWHNEVVPMWISEGFIHPPDRSSSYDDLFLSLCLKKNRWWSRMSKMKVVAATTMYVDCL